MTYYIVLQIKQIVPFWIAGLFMGAVVSAYGNRIVRRISYNSVGRKSVLQGCFIAALAGAASPISAYGMLPILAALMRLNIRQSALSSLIVASILINPNVFVFSFSLGADIALLRLMLSLIAGVAAGLLAEAFFKDANIYNLEGFTEKRTGDSAGRSSLAVIITGFRKGLVRTAPNLALGILLAALFEMYFPMDIFKYAFGKDSGLSVLYAASLGVTTYYCGGGTIPVIKAWMNEGMSTGAVMAFMLTGPPTKITNLTALKTIMPAKSFSLYLAFSILFGIAAGILVNLMITF